ncbi:unnamed protein product, partial [Amoebophrya sp. A25]
SPGDDERTSSGSKKNIKDQIASEIERSLSRAAGAAGTTEQGQSSCRKRKHKKSRRGTKRSR